MSDSQDSLESLPKYSSYIIHLDQKVSPAVLAGIFGINISLIYQESQAGRLPPSVKDATYKECIQWYINYYKKNQDLRIEKERLNAREREKKLELDKELRLEKIRLKELELQNKNETRTTVRGQYNGEDNDQGLHPLLAAKTRQDIRNAIAKENETYLNIAIKKRGYLDIDQLNALAEPFIQAIKNILLDIAEDFPETQSRIDESMENLFELGLRIINKADIDEESFIEEMLSREIDIDSIELDLQRKVL